MDDKTKSRKQGTENGSNSAGEYFNRCWDSSSSPLQKAFKISSNKDRKFFDKNKIYPIKLDAAIRYLLDLIVKLFNKIRF